MSDTALEHYGHSSQNMNATIARIAVHFVTRWGAQRRMGPPRGAQAARCAGPHSRRRPSTGVTCAFRPLNVR